MKDRFTTACVVSIGGLCMYGVIEAYISKLHFAFDRFDASLYVLVEPGFAVHQLQNATGAGNAQRNLRVGKSRDESWEFEQSQQAEISHHVAEIYVSAAEKHESMKQPEGVG